MRLTAPQQVPFWDTTPPGQQLPTASRMPAQAGGISQ